jgi:LmbE family N-acetylglucosaminyl deacetylase
VDANARQAVILSPHLDDAVFSCWHVIDSPRDVSVVNVFTGVPPPGTPLPRWDRITGANDPAQRVRERLEEDRAALAQVGRQATNLPLVEAQYRNEKPRLDEVLPAVADRLAGDEEVFAPAGIGGHSAHLLVREAAFSLAREGVAVSFYADIPYATEFGWPAWVRGVAREPALDVDAHWSEALDPILEAGWQPSVLELHETRARQKIEAMKTYRTQFAALEGGPQRRLTHPELVRYEVSWSKSGS